MEEPRKEHTLLGQTVDVTFNTSDDIAGASNRIVLGISNGMLVCRSQDGTVEWFPLTGIRVIAVQNSRPDSSLAR